MYFVLHLLNYVNKKFNNMLGTIIGGGLNVLANAIGTAVANKRKREAQEALDKQYEQQIGEINTEIGANYLDRADSRQALRKVADANTEALRQLNTSAIRGGATDEAKVAMASKLTRQTAGVVGDLAAMGERHKDRLRDQRRRLILDNAERKYAERSDVSGMERVLQSFGEAAQSLGDAWSTRNNTPQLPVDEEQTNTINNMGVDATSQVLDDLRKSGKFM